MIAYTELSEENEMMQTFTKYEHDSPGTFIILPFSLHIDFLFTKLYNHLFGIWDNATTSLALIARNTGHNT